ncbi:MAG: hypothetical protein A2622_00140 [Bdellovibrionales bacterium RIFCSPHIGHO2_01_FULL_40_29]|nr:MAG: hypothetical protein A2622_00140 [Bdellovibrionales bacterium RIFCSPHIGHO2_01_FULL_40_29]OFZ32536.1 MAG: hypothetical protein A3D17_04740 [Bdellovibrionales bacterium RIFCSPHIGHO2_02_FULL_40_15]
MIILFKYTRALVFIFLTVVCQSTALATVFDQNQITDFQIIAPFSQIKEAKSKYLFLDLKKQKFEGAIQYKTNEGTLVQIPATISFKGFSSLSCPLPKLEFKFKKIDGTIFQGMKKVDLHTHCGEIKDLPNNNLVKSMYFAHREVSAYRILQILEMQSFQALPIAVEYLDSTSLQNPELAPHKKYQAFFLEDKSEFKKRKNVTDIMATNDALKEIDIQAGKTTRDQYIYENAEAHKNILNSIELAKIEFVQNLIGNMDWFLKAHPDDYRFENSDNKAELWNARIFQTLSGEWLPMIQDFNFSSLAMYGKSDTSFPIEIKLFHRLNSSEREDLLHYLSIKKTEILNSIQFLSTDPQFLVLQKTLNERFVQIMKEYQK